VREDMVVVTALRSTRRVLYSQIVHALGPDSEDVNLGSSLWTMSWDVHGPGRLHSLHFVRPGLGVNWVADPRLLE